MSKPRVLVIVGSLRKASNSLAIARGLAEAARDKAQIQVHTLEDVPLYNEDLDKDNKPAGVVALKQAIKDSDGLVVISPEYNYGISGVLKNALDWASRPGYQSVLRGKPALTITSSPGLLGGARAQGQIRQTLMAVLAEVVVCPEITLVKVGDKVKDGKLSDPDALKVVLDGFEALLADIAKGAR